MLGQPALPNHRSRVATYEHRAVGLEDVMIIQSVGMLVGWDSAFVVRHLMSVTMLFCFRVAAPSHARLHPSVSAIRYVLVEHLSIVFTESLKLRKLEAAVLS